MTGRRSTLQLAIKKRLSIDFGVLGNHGWAGKDNLKQEWGIGGKLFTEAAVTAWWWFCTQKI